MKLFKRFVAAGIIFILYFSCKKEVIVPATSSANYFPVEKGKYIIYDVDSVFHAENDNNTDDSVYAWHFQMKEIIDETYIDGERRPAQIIKQYRRDNDTMDWVQTGVCTQVRTATAAFKTVDNITYHKMAFPITDQVSWDGNDVNTLSEEMYHYQDIHVSMVLGTLSFDSTVSVLQIDESNFIEKTYGLEIYANHIGMIYKERDELHKVNDQIVSGVVLKMTARGYGTE
jgi:hypothetical protein